MRRPCVLASDRGGKKGHFEITQKENHFKKNMKNDFVLF